MLRRFRTAPSMPRWRSDVAVNDGVMRPPITVTRISAKLTPASSACRASPRSPRSRPRWKAALHDQSTTSTSSSGVLRLRSRTSGRPMNAPRTGRNARSTAATSANGQDAALPASSLPSSHSADIATSGPPANPRRPVQLGTAVSRNPATAAQTKPNNISCPCQRAGGHDVASGRPSVKLAAHSGTISSAARPAPRKNGRKP
jgi:hypothetical protein